MAVSKKPNKERMNDLKESCQRFSDNLMLLKSCQNTKQGTSKLIESTKQFVVITGNYLKIIKEGTAKEVAEAGKIINRISFVLDEVE